MCVWLTAPPSLQSSAEPLTLEVLVVDVVSIVQIGGFVFL